MRKRKLSKILLTVTYYTLLCLVFCIIFTYELEFGIIISFSNSLFGICCFLLPIILLINPIILKSVYKINFYKSILYSALLFIIYLIIVLTIILGIKWNFKKFSEEKWTQYENLRYMMLDDFEQKYNLLEMTKQDVLNVLGGEIEEGDNEMQYFIGCRNFFWEYYCLYFDKEGKVSETNVTKFYY